MTLRIAYEEVTQQVDAAWSAWVNAIEGLDDFAMTETGPCGEWTMTDLTFHLAFWDEQAGFDLQFRHDNDGAAPPSRDWQSMNDDDHARHAGRPPGDGLKVMHATHESLMHLVAAHRDDELSWLVPDLVDHYNEHTAQVQEWRSAKGI